MSPTSADRPNIVVFIPDQLRADALGCFGNPVASTPNIDALAQRSVRFTNAFGQHPTCTQSRVSFLTGLYPHVRGHRTLHQLLKPWEPDAISTLKAAGYHVAHAGTRGDTWATGGTKEATSRFGWSVAPERLHAPDPYGPDHRLGRAFYIGRREEDFVDYDEAVILTAEDWLAEGLPEPWVLYVPLLFPHPEFEVADPWFSMHDRSAVPMPIPFATTSPAPVFRSLIHERYGLARLDESDWREIIATYYGMVSRMDDHLRRVLEAVDRTGSTDRTAVLFYPDHGEYLGDHGLVEKWIAGVEPALVHNPLMIHVPGGREGVVIDAMVELLDVAPTLMDLGRVAEPHRNMGRSLVPLLMGDTDSHRDAAFSEGGVTLLDAERSEQAAYPYDLKHVMQVEVPMSAGKVTAMRTREWTYVHRVHESAELYHRAEDPSELHNLIGDESLAGVVSDLRSAMLDWSTETADLIGPHDPRFDFDGAQFP